MLSIFKKKKPNVFLGTLYVAPRHGLKTVDEWTDLAKFNFAEGLKFELIELFSLKKLSDVSEVGESDIALDLAVSNYQCGYMASIEVGGDYIPFFLRPKVTIYARIYNARSGKNIYQLKQTQKISYSAFFKRQFTWRIVFGYQADFTEKEVGLLFYEASLKLLSKIKRKSKL